MRNIFYVFIVFALIAISAIFGVIYFFFSQSQSGSNSAIVHDTVSTTMNTSIDSNNNKELTTPNSHTMSNPTVYASFIINVHDWTSPEKSIDTLNKIIDIHETYEVPVDVYLDDQMVQIYFEQASDLLNRLKTSEYVSVSYHIRPPAPYYSGFDWLGLSDLPQYNLIDKLTSYETSSIDLSTGEPTSTPGGYSYLKTLIGYAPYTVSISSQDRVGKALNTLYTSMGAKLVAIHGGETTFGSSIGSLFVRPETIEIKAYEERRHYAAQDVLSDALADVDLGSTQFLNLKWHENNFYTSGTPFDAVYYDGGDRSKPLSPPFDISKANDPSVTQPKSQTEQDEQWERYEGLVKIVSEQTEIYSPINTKNIYELLSR